MHAPPVRAALGLVPFLLMSAAGCLDEAQRRTTLVPTNPFTNAVVSPPAKTALVAASEAAANRAVLVGQKVIAANPQLGLRPSFLVAGAPKPEVFHNGTAVIYVTEPLVKQCATDGQLAAVLCHELGKMVAEREALAGPDSRAARRRPPEDVPVGNDRAGALGAPDGTRLAELARFEAQNPRAETTSAVPDPEALARGFYQKTGFPAADFDAAAPLLRAASKNGALERQLTAPPAAP